LAFGGLPVSLRRDLIGQFVGRREGLRFLADGHACGIGKKGGRTGSDILFAVIGAGKKAPLQTLGISACPGGGILACLDRGAPKVVKIERAGAGFQWLGFLGCGQKTRSEPNEEEKSHFLLMSKPTLFANGSPKRKTDKLRIKEA